MSDTFQQWKEIGFNDEQKATLLVAEWFAKVANKDLRWWQRKRHPMDAVPLAREAVAVLLVLPEGRALSRRILAKPNEFDTVAGPEETS